MKQVASPVRIQQDAPIKMKLATSKALIAAWWAYPKDGDDMFFRNVV
jgi:hypothetical protein